MTVTTAPEAAFEAVAVIVEHRASTYRLLAELLAPPAPPLVDRLADGSLAADLRAAVGWLGAEAGWFTEAADALDGTLAAGPGLDALAAEHHRLFDPDAGAAGDISVVGDEVVELAAATAREAAWWRAEDASSATAERQAVQDRLRRTLGVWADEVHELVTSTASLGTYPAATDALARFVDLELGRGFERSRLPWRDRRGGG